MEYLLPYLCMVTVPHIMVVLERMLDYRGVGLARFHCSIYDTMYSGFESTIQQPYPGTGIWLYGGHPDHVLKCTFALILHPFQSR